LFAGKSKKQQAAAFKIQKAASIAAATIDTYRGATAAFAQTPGGIVIKSLAAAAAVTAGLLNIKTIASTKFEGGGAPSGGGGSAPNLTSPSSAPSFNVVGSGGANQLATLESAPVKAFVVSGEVSSAQSLDRNRQQNATF
jgi:hypothetical protein